MDASLARSVVEQRLGRRLGMAARPVQRGAHSLRLRRSAEENVMRGSQAGNQAIG